jgi:hypothetical protein
MALAYAPAAPPAEDDSGRVNSEPLVLAGHCILAERLEQPSTRSGPIPKFAPMDPRHAQGASFDGQGRWKSGKQLFHRPLWEGSYVDLSDPSC